MKDYKVGDRVWVISEKRYGIVSDIEDTPQGLFIHIDNRHSYVPHLIHQSADSMFEELGYEVENGKDYIEYRDEDNMREITIYTDEKTVNCCYYDYEDELPLRFTMQEHQAIHQKLIELGWIE